MKPRFALNLSHDGIGLLHRSAGGWTLVGEVALTAPDMGDELKMLRATATALESGGVTSKLVIPDSQILYTTLDVTANGAAGEVEIRKGLDGLTPYAVDDLVFDYDVKDGRAQVAVVARETLQEAEEFASEYRFNPVTFVAIPEDGQFPREPSFGLTTAAATLIPVGDTLEPDAAPIVIVERNAPADSDEAPKAAPEPSPAPSPAPIAEPETSPAPDAEEEAAQEAPAVPRIAPLLPPETRPSFTTSRQGPVVASPEPAKRAARITLLPTPEGEAPKLAGAERNVGVTAPLPPDLAEPPAPAKTKKPARKEKPVKPKPKPEPKPEPVLKTTGPIATAIAPPPVDEAEALTVFGARRTQEQPGKPRYLGLILTVVLLLAMAAIALWSALFSARDVALLPDAAENTVPSITAPPVEEIAPAPAEIIEAPTAVVEAPAEPDPAEPAPEELASQPVEPEIEAAPPPPMSEEDARTAYAATGIWQLAPAAPPVPQQDTLDDVYIASIDPEIIGEDAVALPPAEQDPTDPPLDAPGLPPAPGQVFTLDERGLVTPSVDGTLSPEGHRVYSGKPPLVPPARPQSAEGLTPQEETDAQTERTRLLVLRPRTRPDNLADRQERAETGGGFSQAELAAKKPRTRPPSAQDTAAVTEAEAEADGEEDNGTEESVVLASSRVPQTRPPNFESAVQKALKEAQSAAPAVPAAAAVTPKIPTTASVAKQATITNAINLSKVNLIGVYGSSSDRRALVRLPTGRYIKVQVGDRIDGGKVAAIGESELRYVKNGRNIVLKMPASS